MAYGEAEDAGGPAPAKDNNEAVRHFIRRTLPILKCLDYMKRKVPFSEAIIKAKPPSAAIGTGRLIDPFLSSSWIKSSGE